MLGDSLRDLKLDRRLANRRGWVAPGDLEKALAALPDVSDKKAEPPPPPPAAAGEAPERP